MSPFSSHDEFRTLPLDLRRRWWSETDYGKREPSQELVALIREKLSPPTVVVADEQEDQS